MSDETNVRTKLDRLLGQVDVLFPVIKGTGEALAVLDKEVSNIRQTTDELKARHETLYACVLAEKQKLAHLEERMKHREAENTDTKSKKWEVVKMVIRGLITIILAIIAFFLGLSKP